MLSFLDTPGKQIFLKKGEISNNFIFLSKAGKFLFLWTLEHNKILYLLMTKPKNRENRPHLTFQKEKIDHFNP